MKIGLLGCKGTTLDLLNGLIERGIAVSQVVTLREDLGASQNVAFFKAGAIHNFCANRNIPCKIAESYNLKLPVDQAFFSDVRLDLLLVIGWERLLPDEVLRTFGRFACGMHGSPFGLPKGRGRSPMNWSLITGQGKFLTYLFRYTPGMDDGDVIGMKAFDINEHDTIATLHMKNRIAMLELVATYLPQIEAGKVAFWPQPPEAPTFYPRRTAEDGIIDWSWPTSDIHQFVRALVPPYPGAFAFLNGRKLIVEQAQPFDKGLLAHGNLPGTIVDVSVAEGRFVVRTIDGSLLVTRFTGTDIGEIRPGLSLVGGDQKAILARIAERYDPALPSSTWEIKPTRLPPVDNR